MRENVVAELLEHAEDELRHAEMIADRMIQLGGTPPINPSEWFEKTNCGYSEPSDAFVKKIIDQNIAGEQCAIGAYKKLLEEAKEVDFITYSIVLQILKDEVEHEDDLQSLAEDFDLMMGYKNK